MGIKEDMLAWREGVSFSAPWRERHIAANTVIDQSVETLCIYASSDCAGITNEPMVASSIRSALDRGVRVKCIFGRIQSLETVHCNPLAVSLGGKFSEICRVASCHYVGRVTCIMADGLVLYKLNDNDEDRRYTFCSVNRVIDGVKLKPKTKAYSAWIALHNFYSLFYALLPSSSCIPIELTRLIPPEPLLMTAQSLKQLSNSSGYDGSQLCALRVLRTLQQTS